MRVLRGLLGALLWIVAALLQPLASLLPTGSGETPKVYSLLIPILFLLLAFGSTALMARALAEPGAAAGGGGM